MMSKISIKDPMYPSIMYGTPAHHATIKAQKPAINGPLSFLDRISREYFLPEEAVVSASRLDRWA